jgi:hypothetical protein
MADDYMNMEGSGVTCAEGEACEEIFVTTEYRIGDKLQIRHWQTTRSGEIKLDV